VQPLAGSALWSADPVAAAARPAVRPTTPRAPGLAATTTWRVVFDGEGIDLGRPRRVVVKLAASGERLLEYDDGARFWIAPGGEAIERVARGDLDARGSLERAIGAPLALALAVRGVYLLHASALRLDRRVIALAADSGVGKSTLAAAVERAPGLGLRRVADDILPVRLGAASAALPHFPQLKLAAADGYPPAAPGSWPLGALVELERCEPVPAGDVAPIRFERLSGAPAALALTRATVASRLFDEALLTAHLAACAAAADALVVARLRFPSGLDRLPATLERLTRELR
jgi:hypothetical protein